MERKRFAIKRGSLRDITKYLIYAFLLFMTTYAHTAGGIRPFGLGLFVALIFARQNLIILAPVYIAACIHADPTWQSAVIGITPAFIFPAAYFINGKLNKKLGLTAGCVFTTQKQIP